MVDVKKGAPAPKTVEEPKESYALPKAHKKTVEEEPSDENKSGEPGQPEQQATATGITSWAGSRALTSAEKTALCNAKAGDLTLNELAFLMASVNGLAFAANIQSPNSQVKIRTALGVP